MAVTINGTTGVSAGAHPFLVGQVCTFAMATPPSGFVKCNGALLSRATYASLFTAIGTTYGAGDGSTTFGLPDLRGEFLRGWDDARGVDSGRALGSAQLDQLQSHLHGLTNLASVLGGGGTGANMAAGGSNFPTSAPLVDGANGTPRVGAETRPRNVALMVAIFTGV